MYLIMTSTQGGIACRSTSASFHSEGETSVSLLGSPVLPRGIRSFWADPCLAFLFEGSTGCGHQKECALLVKCPGGASVWGRLFGHSCHIGESSIRHDDLVAFRCGPEHFMECMNFTECVSLHSVPCIDLLVKDVSKHVMENLTGSYFFDHSLENVTLPMGLQSYAFGDGFNQSLKNATLPTGIQSLTFGKHLSQGLENVTLPTDRQSLTGGYRFAQSLENVTLSVDLQSLTFAVASTRIWRMRRSRCARRISHSAMSSTRVWRM